MSSLATHSPFSIEALAPISDKLVLQDLLAQGATAPIAIAQLALVDLPVAIDAT